MMNNNTKINPVNLFNALNTDNILARINTKTKSIETKPYGFFEKIWNKLTGNESHRLLNIVNTYIKLLEEIGTKGNDDQVEKKTLENLSEQISFIMEKIKPSSEKKQLEKTIKRIEVAAHYKTTIPLGKKDEENNRLSDLKEWAKAFKKDDKVYKGDDKDLSLVDNHALAHASRYNDFFTLLDNDPALRIAFLKWTIRDGNSAKTFILFPQLADRISACALSPRYGHFHRQYMERKLDPEKKPLPEGSVKPLNVILKDGKYRVKGNFVDGSKVPHKVNLLNGGSTINMGTKENELLFTVNDIFKSVQGKKKDIVGNFEMFNGALHNWNSQKFGKLTNIDAVTKKPEYSNINFSKPDWWVDMPAFETLTKEEAQKQFGSAHLDGKNWGVYAVGARDQAKIDFGGNHAYKMILIPTEDGKGYNVYPIGTFTKDFPQGLGMLGFLLNSVEGDLRFDENVYYSHRQKAGVLFEMAPEKAHQYMDLIKRKLRMSVREETAFADKHEKTAYTDNFIARRLHEMDQYATKLVKGFKDQNCEIDLKPIINISKNSLDKFYKGETLNKNLLGDIINEIMHNINLTVSLETKDPKETAKRKELIAQKLEEKIRGDYERLHFQLNQTKYMFQFTNKNCAWNVQEELEEILGKESEGGVVPDMFSIELTKTQPSNFLKYFVGFARILKGPLSRVVIRTACRILGAGRSFQYGKTKKDRQSVEDTTFWKTAKIYSPAHFVNQIKEGNINKVYSAVV